MSQAVDELKIGRALFPSTDTRALQQELSTIITFAMRLWKPGLLIIDRAGSGKTNIVCHEVASRAGDVPVVLIFGRQPLVGPQSLLEEVHRSLHLASDGTSLDIDRLDRMTDEAGTYLFVVIDGINEQRDLIRLDNSIAHFLRWAADHRVRVLLTCRDIYWSFFDHGKWTGDLHDIHRDALGDFTRQEYNAALPTYLAAFNLRCTLAGQALRACQYPLLLRFFCEAYGSVDGPTRELGEINEIRLKELFDEYWSRKTDEIRRRLGHANATLIEEYLASLVSHMFTTGVTSVLSSELAGITGDSDTATGSSMYVQLLDEDIILEEHPTEDGLIRRVGFVYEAFMEYVLARTIMRRPNDFGLRSLDEAVGLLMAGVDRWVNSRGVAEFVAVMMFDYRNVKQTWAFLAQLVNGGPTWIEAFWAILTKVRVNWLDESLYDLLPRAVIGEGGEKGLLRALAGLGRLEDLTSSELGEAILWTVFMPGVLSWSDAGRLPSFTQAELTSFTNRIAETRQSGLQKSPVRFAYNIFPAARECLPPAQGKEVDKLCKRFTSPGRPTEVIRIIWRMFPERRILLLNGLFADDLDLRGICAERLQFVRTGRVAALKCMQSIVKHEKEPDIRTLIEHSIEMLRREEERTERAARPLYSAEGRPRRIDRRKPRRRR